jgi:hypothetical protein
MNAVAALLCHKHLRYILAYEYASTFVYSHNTESVQNYYARMVIWYYSIAAVKLDSISRDNSPLRPCCVYGLYTKYVHITQHPGIHHNNKEIMWLAKKNLVEVF